MMMTLMTSSSSSSFDNVSNHTTTRLFKKKASFRCLNTPTTTKTTAVKGRKVSIKAEAISEDSSSSSKNSDIFADLVENASSFSSFGGSSSAGSTNNNGFVGGEHISSFNQNQSISNTKNALKVFSRSAHPELSTEIANYLGMDLGKLTIKKFADGEIYVQINESSELFFLEGEGGGRGAFIGCFKGEIGAAAPAFSFINDS